MNSYTSFDIHLQYQILLYIYRLSNQNIIHENIFFSAVLLNLFSKLIVQSDRLIDL